MFDVLPSSDGEKGKSSNPSYTTHTGNEGLESEGTSSALTFDKNWQAKKIKILECEVK